MVEEKQQVLEQVRVILLERRLDPLSLAEKLKRGGRFVDASGRPKVPKVDIRPADLIIAKQLERYASEHWCDLCDVERKSERVVWLHNTRTNETFYAANNCLEHHFGVTIDRLEDESEELLELLDAGIRQLEATLDVEDDTGTALDLLLNRFDEFVSFECAAVREAKEHLQVLRNSPHLTTRGTYTKHLQDIQQLLVFQQDHRKNPKRFSDRWRALRTHPAKEAKRQPWPQVAFGHVLEQPEVLTLKDVRALTETLKFASGYDVLLTTPLAPWLFPSRQAYLAALDAHYLREAEEAVTDRPLSLSDKDQNRLGDMLLKHAEKQQALTFGLYTWHTPHLALERFTPPNWDTFLALTENLGRYVKSSIHAARIPYRGELRQAYACGVAVFVPNRWSNTFALWHAYGGESGRKELSSFDASPFNAPKGRPVKKASGRVKEAKATKRLKSAVKHPQERAAVPFQNVFTKTALRDETDLSIKADLPVEIQEQKSEASDAFDQLVESIQSELSREVSNDERIALGRLVHGLHTAKRRRLHGEVVVAEENLENFRKRLLIQAGGPPEPEIRDEPVTAVRAQQETTRAVALKVRPVPA
jgi:hypothetical protein